jgi:hypothetical protein
MQGVFEERFPAADRGIIRTSLRLVTSFRLWEITAACRLGPFARQARIVRYLRSPDGWSRRAACEFRPLTKPQGERKAARPVRGFMVWPGRPGDKIRGFRWSGDD